MTLHTIFYLLALLSHVCGVVIALPGMGGCFVPDLSNIITRNQHDQIIRSGSYIANESKLVFDCPSHNWRIGSSENMCRESQWVMDFPYCQPYIEYIYSRVLIVFCLLMSILIFIIYWARKNPTQWQHQKICLIEPNDDTPVSSITNVSQL